MGPLLVELKLLRPAATEVLSGDAGSRELACLNFEAQTAAKPEAELFCGCAHPEREQHSCSVDPPWE